MHCLFSDGLLLKLSCREGIDHPAGIKLCFSCDEHSVMHIPDTTDIMGIRIDGGEQPGLFRFVAVTPVQIESPWIGMNSIGTPRSAANSIQLFKASLLSSRRRSCRPVGWAIQVV